MGLSDFNLSDLHIARRELSGSRTRFRPFANSVLVFAFAAGVGWWLVRPKPLEVRTALAHQTVRDDEERTSLDASGYVVARQAATVSSKSTGKITQVLVEEGMKVEPGQVLARLDDANLVASLRLAEAQLQAAQAMLRETQVRIREAQHELGRQGELMKSRIESPGEYDHATATVQALEAKLEQQQAEVTVAQRQVASWQQQLEDTVIRAPFGGIVTSKDAQPGETISPVSAGGGYTRTGICTLVDMHSLEVEIDVNESYIHHIEPGQKVEATLDAYPEWTIPCRVIAIVPTADRQKSTVRVRVGFDALDRRILPEMSVKVAFRDANRPEAADGHMVLVPRAALRHQDGHDLVWVLQHGRAERRVVTVNRTDADEARISAGIGNGEQVIVDWPKGLTDGQTVKQTQLLSQASEDQK